MFVFNYQYETTGVADSLRKGMIGIKENLLSIDGDILINPSDFESFVSFQKEALAITEINSAEPVKAIVRDGKVEHLSKYEGNMQWPGIVKIKSNRFLGDSSHVYDIINNILPLDAFVVNAREIDTQEDYDNALEWFEGGQIE